MPNCSKPKYPLSAYNLFFQVERKRILDGTDRTGNPITEQEIIEVGLEHKKKTERRRHRKSHGKIGFGELARTIAYRWKRLDRNSRHALEQQALIEKQEYIAKIKAWREQQEANAAKAHKGQLQNSSQQVPVGAQTVLQTFIDQYLNQNSSRINALEDLQNMLEVEINRLASNTGGSPQQMVAPHSFDLLRRNQRNSDHFHPTPAFLPAVETNRNGTRQDIYQHTISTRFPDRQGSNSQWHQQEVTPQDSVVQHTAYPQDNAATVGMLNDNSRDSSPSPIPYNTSTETVLPFSSSTLNALQQLLFGDS